MYPESLLWWLGGIAVLLGLIGCIALLALAVDTWYQRHIEKRHGAPGDDDGRTRVALILLAGTFALVAVAIALYEAGEVGWAQFLLVLASGTAGAGCVAALDRDT